MIQFYELVDLETSSEIVEYVKHCVDTDLSKGIPEKDAYRVVGTDYNNLYCIQHFSCNNDNVCYLYFRNCNESGLNCLIRYDCVLGKLVRLTDYVYFDWIVTEDVTGAVILRKDKETSLSDIVIGDTLIENVYSCSVRKLAESGYVLVVYNADHTVQRVYGINLIQAKVTELNDLNDYIVWSCNVAQGVDAIIDRTEVELWLKNESILSEV